MTASFHHTPFHFAEALKLLSEGFVDPALFDGSPPCDTKSDPLVGNVVYAYQGIGLDPARFADDFDCGVAG